MSLESDLAVLREHWREYDQFHCDERAGRYVALLEIDRAALARRVEELEKVREAAKALREKMAAVYKTDEYRGVWGLYRVHGGDYSNGPNWIDEQEALDAALAACEDVKK